MAPSCFARSSIVSCSIVTCSIAYTSSTRKTPIPNTPLYLSSFRPETKNHESAACYHQNKMASQTPESALIRPRNLLGKSPEELRTFLESLGEPAYRGAQIYHALYAERRFAFTGMTNLPAKLRDRLSRGAVIDLPRVLRKHCSDDGTIRYVLALDAAAQDSAAKDSEKTARSLTPATIETGVMPEENRQTIW